MEKLNTSFTILNRFLFTYYSFWVDVEILIFKQKKSSSYPKSSSSHPHGSLRVVTKGLGTKKETLQLPCSSSFTRIPSIREAMLNIWRSLVDYNFYDIVFDSQLKEGKRVAQGIFMLQILVPVYQNLSKEGFWFCLVDSLFLLDFNLYWVGLTLVINRLSLT